MIEKKDWQKVLDDNTKSLEDMTKQFNLTKPQFEAMIALAKLKLSEFPAEKEADPMPEELKKGLDEFGIGAGKNA